MSIIFGIINSNNEPVRTGMLSTLAGRTGRFAPDGTYIDVRGPIGMGFQPYHTTERSSLESQPLFDVNGDAVVFDGRLDNYEELRRELDINGDESPDSTIVLAAFRKWREDCFSHFIGDWALSLWSERDHKLYLARDHAGTRTLYYQETDGGLKWSTYLETFLPEADSQKLNEEFVGRFLGGLPIRTSTPYSGVRAVQPAHFMIFTGHKISSKPHWSPIEDNKLMLKSDFEYDECFVSLLEQSIKRRTVSGSSILAELSGGMDSTAIVCVSDRIRRREDPAAALLDTISFYDDSEPDWNEQPYFLATERQRGKTGIHISTPFLDQTLEDPASSQGYFTFPGSDGAAFKRHAEFEDRIAAKDYRVILSGIGGDELLGGVPTPYPELADYIYSLRFGKFVRRSTEWCLSNRIPFPHMFLRTMRFAGHMYTRSSASPKDLVPWIAPSLQRACIELAQQDRLGPRYGHSPSSIRNAQNWWSILETQPHRYPKNTMRREYRYPYLDRDLASFLLRLPREQLVQPGRRRAMMRRALKEIIPAEVLERRRKAFLGRGPLALLQKEQANIEHLFSTSCAEAYGFIHVDVLKSALRSALRGADTSWVMPLLRTAVFELWLRSHAGQVSQNDFMSPATNQFLPI